MAKEFEYVPKLFREENAEFEGKFVIKKARCTERWERITKVGIDVTKLGELEATSLSNALSLMRLVELNADLIVSVDVTRKATGEKYTTLEDVMMESELDAVVFDLGGLFIAGRPLA